MRDGLPSHPDIGESLLKPAEFTVYVRDRKPVVRTSGRAYVLPRSGQRGIPLTSVNTAQISVDLLRVGDRALVATIAAGFPQPLTDMTRSVWRVKPLCPCGMVFSRWTIASIRM